MEPEDLLNPYHPLSPFNENGIYSPAYKSRPLNEVEAGMMLFFLTAVFLVCIGVVIYTYVESWLEQRQRAKEHKLYLDRLDAQEARRLSRQKE